MKNDTLSTYIWLILMALLVLALRTADGGMDALLTQAVSLVSTATTSAVSAAQETSLPEWQFGSFWFLLVVGGVLAVCWQVIRPRSGDGTAVAGVRKHLAIEYKLQAKDLDNG